MRHVIPILGMSLLVAACDGVACTPLGEIYFAKELGAECCADLAPVTVAEIPMDDFEGDGMPEGCGLGDAPVDVKQCLPCGNGTCDAGEQFCNCPEDCPRPS